jgi:hypothetical protein
MQIHAVQCSEAAPQGTRLGTPSTGAKLAYESLLDMPRSGARCSLLSMLIKVVADQQTQGAICTALMPKA